MRETLARLAHMYGKNQPLVCCDNRFGAATVTPSELMRRPPVGEYYVSIGLFSGSPVLIDEHGTAVLRLPDLPEDD